MGVLDFLQRGTAKDRFAQKVMRRAKVRGWAGAAPQYSPQRFSLKFGDEHTLYLDNCFASWNKLEGADKDRQIDILLGILFEPKRNASFEIAAPYLLPAVRNRSHLANSWLVPGFDSARGIYDDALQPLCDVMAVIPVIDSETTISYVARKTLEDWGETFDTVMATALANLRAISPCKFIRDERGFWISDYGDHHDAARLLLPHLFEQLDLRGDPVAIALDRAALLVAGADDMAALNAMAALAEDEYAKSDRPIACAPIILRLGHWTPLESSAPGLEALDRLRVLHSLHDYAEQKAQLEAKQLAEGTDIFVASLASVTYEGRIDTWAVWGTGVDTLLPRADIVVFARGQGDSFERQPRRWADVDAAFGPFTPEPDLYPPRYRLKTWPDGAWQRAESLSAPDWAKA